MANKKLTDRDLQILFLKAQHFVASRSLNVQGTVELDGFRISLLRYSDHFAARPSPVGVLIDSVCVIGGLNTRRKFLGKRAVYDGEFLYLNCSSNQACRRVLAELNRYWVLEELARV